MKMKFDMVMNIKMPTRVKVGISKCITMTNEIVCCSEKIVSFVHNLIVTKIENSMLMRVEHEKSFISSGQG